MRLSLLSVAVLLGLLWMAGPANTADKSLRAGAYAQNITPEKWPVSVHGALTDIKASKSPDTLHARCLVLENEVRSLAFVVVDSCMVPRDVFDEAKALITKVTGIPADHMLMSATHSHTSVTVTGVFQSEPEEEYKRLLVRKIAVGVERAWRQREPAQIGWGVGSDPRNVFKYPVWNYLSVSAKRDVWKLSAFGN